MTTLVAIGKNTVTEKNNSAQVYLGSEKFISNALGGRGTPIKYTVIGDNTLVATPDSFDTKSLNGKTLDKTFIVHGKGAKPVLDIKIKAMPKNFVKGVKLKIISMKGKLIITVHSESDIKIRNEDIIETISEGKELKIATIFVGSEMRQYLKRSGLDQHANDLSCQLAIELEPTALQAAIQNNKMFWNTNSLAAVNELTNLDFSKMPLPTDNGLIVDATQFDIETDKASGKQRQIGADDDHDQNGSLFLTVIEVLKRTNPAFVNIEVTKSATLSNSSNTAKNLSTVMTVFCSLLNSLGYNIEQTTHQINNQLVTSLLAISNGLSIDDINICHVQSNNRIHVSPTYIGNTGAISQRVQTRESNLLNNIKTNNPIVMGSAFSGGGFLDRSLHDGLASMGLDSICKFGIEWIESYFNSNLSNNSELWSDESYFLLGDIRNVNVYKKPLPLLNGIAMGVPCIGASSAGSVKNKISCAEEHEIAGALFVSSLEVIKSSNPAFIIIENVPEYQNTLSMHIIRSVLNSLGYDITENVFSGNEFGALENRKRLVMLATSKGLSSSNNPISNITPSIKKQASLNDIIEDVPVYDKSWSWRDYFETKAKNDLKRGVVWRHQTLTGEEGHCGTIGRSYMKGRSTEPFLIFDLDKKFNKLHSRLINNECPHSIFNEIIYEPGFCHMYINFCENLVSKYNRRHKLVGDDKRVSEFVENIRLFAPVDPKELCSKFDSNLVLTSKEAINEFIDATYAISKATRLLTVNEHAAVKRIPVNLVNGLTKTIAHEVMGNSVVFSLFESLGRSLGAWLLNLASKGSVELFNTKQLIMNELIDHDGQPTQRAKHLYTIIPNVDSMYFINKQKVSKLNSCSLHKFETLAA